MRKFLTLAIAIALSGLAGLAQARQPLVDADWVKNNIGKADVVFLDVRGKLGGKSKADYLRAHIPGAVYTNYLKDGWRTKDKNGTVGMLPATAKLEKLIGGLGIDNNTHVVIVSNGGKALDMGTSTRIYWTFKVLGHDNVSILNGGMMAYAKVDPKTKKTINPLEKGAIKPQAKSFKGTLRTDMIATKSDVQAAIKSGMPLVDNRTNNQYVGVNKHGKGKRYGTIPGAKNVPENWFTKNGGGTFRNAAALKKLYSAAGVPTTGDQISFCNTGHWASLGWFASHELLGNEKAKMYDGSMVEWSADKSLPMEQHVKFE